MKYRSDWSKSQARFEAFWQGEIIDRCMVAVMAPPMPPAHAIKDDHERYRAWTDPEYIIARNRQFMSQTYYAGEAFPQIFVDLGAGGHAGFYKNAKYQFEDSLWFFPSLAHPDDLQFDEQSFLYQKTLELAKAFVKDSGGDYFVSMPDSTGNADALSHLMGPDGLMEAMLDEPDAVSRALHEIQHSYHRIMTEMQAIVSDNNLGGTTVGWLRTWAPGLHAQMQCDMSVMISPAMFDAFIMPELRAQCELLDYPLYHFDGIEQIRHLDSLLSIENLKAIQWTQVSGQPPATDYIPELKKIQSAGKNLVILVQPQQIEPLMAQLSSKGLYLIADAETKQEADQIVNLVAKLTHD